MIEATNLSQAERDERREQHDERKRVEHLDTLRYRRMVPLHMRLESAENALLRLGAVKSGGVEPVRKGESSAVFPPGGDLYAVAHLHPNEVRFHFRIIESHLERLEEALDVHRGLAPARNFAAMGTHEKNAFILTECVGMRPDDIAALTPNGELGSPRAIRHAREDWAGNPRNKWPGGAVRGVCGHQEGGCDQSCPPLKGKRGRF